MKWEGIIFDWAGTTVDYGSMDPVTALRTLFEQKGIPVTNEEVRKPMGIRKWDHIAAMLKMPRIAGEWQKQFGTAPTRSDVDALYSEFQPLLMQLLQRGTVVKEHTVATMEELHRRGYQIGSTTGYTDAMMEPILKSAADQGYRPDFCVTPDHTDGYGRPYPYMIFRTMEHFKWQHADRVLKVGDTASDIAEGKNAGAKTVGIIMGSSAMGCSPEEYAALSDAEKTAHKEKAAALFKKAGADYILDDIQDVLSLAE